MRPSPFSKLNVRRVAIAVRGVVQGVGFRPFVYNAARSRGLSGSVRNLSGTVRIELQGDPAAVDSFIDALRDSPPPQSRIESLDIEDMPLDPAAESTSFVILSSEGELPPRPAIPADLATCRDCLEEIFDPAERRHNYPFTNCTNCGPRWSIVERIPYDRPRTSMASFEMCAACRAEYENPADRRFHAQPIACPRCGPRLQLLDNRGKELAVGEDALCKTAEAIRAGKIVALKGLGGFQLLVDATNAEAVARLRDRKRRPDRPFALMMASLEEVRKYCRVSEEEARQLTSHQAPIVLLKRQAAEAASPQCSPLSSLLSPLAPGNPYLGVMLPYTPLHHLLMRAVGRPIVCTSGNLSEEPMAIETDDALRRLGPIADLMLTHDRPIVRPVDDSIVRIGPAGPQVLRRARGFAPLPIEIKTNMQNPPAVLAVGGHLKNTVALTLNVGVAVELPSQLNAEPPSQGRQFNCRPNRRSVQVILSAHVGDLESALSVEVFRRAIDDLLEFYQTAPEIIACDLHPDYASTRHAEQVAERFGVPLLRVQHHHAHAAACMAEHGLSGPALAFTWDGTGYGPDGTVWGGETLLCEGADYRRVARLRTFPLPGGDRAVREPRRSALGVLFELFGREAARYAAEWFEPRELEGLLSILDKRINSPRTSSMGRLFDAAAALCGLPTVTTFEGQAAMALEFAADEKVEDSYDFTLEGSDIIDWEPLIRAILSDRAAGVPVESISARFHNTLAEVVLLLGRHFNCRPNGLPIVLSGGCFQNALLSERVNRRLSADGFSVYNHFQTPPGDGCVALGQAAVALA
ncbi:MAG: carbamoyltransferase HypF [Pirellulales bacterium]|nr:carbamoyltransferase HypF [Pirellulales bacterium]